MEVKLAAISSLGKIGGVQAKKHLQSLMRHKSQAVRDITEQALNEIGALDIPDDLQMSEFGDHDGN
jgi:HEAT repeat protein